MGNTKVLWYFNTVTKKKEKRKVVVEDSATWVGHYKPPSLLYNDKGEKLLAFVPLNIDSILQGIIDE